MAETIQLKVAGDSNPSSVAGAIYKNLAEKKMVELLCVGAGPVNQAAKAIAIASGFLAPSGVVLSTRIGFVDITIDGEPRTAIKFKLIES